MFERSAIDPWDRGTKRRSWSIPFSVLTHVAVVGVLLAASYVVIEQVQDPDIVISFLSTAPPPPPPPPPPGGGQKPRKTDVMKPVAPETLVQPTEVPKQIAETPPSEGDEGVEGGVEGGVPGGVPGGVVGGVVGGVLGGILGGVQGGVLGSGEAPVLVSGDIKPPQLVRKVEPLYPEVARRARVSGRVILQAIINGDGDVEGITVLRSNPLLEQAAIEAVRQWKYKPATHNGRPVKVYFTVLVDFILN